MTTSITQEVLSYEPALKDLEKSAEAIEGLSTKSKDDTLFSYVKAEYMEKVAHLFVDPIQRASLRKAASLYGVSEDAQKISDRIISRVNIKKAQEMEKSAELVIAQDNFDAMCGGVKNIDKLVKVARVLFDTYETSIESDNIKKYSCAGFLNKEAAYRSLVVRHKLTGNEAFEKLATAMNEIDTANLSLEERRKFADFVHGLDKRAGIAVKGFDIYNEVFLTKEAEVASAMLVTLTGTKKVPVAKIQAIAPDLKDALGEDVVKELKGDPMQVKQVIESLPMDLKSIIARYV